jgi:hypothetical protein
LLDARTLTVKRERIMSKLYARLSSDARAKDVTSTAHNRVRSTLSTLVTFVRSALTRENIAACVVVEHSDKSDADVQADYSLALRMTYNRASKRARVLLRSDVALDVQRVRADSVASTSLALESEHADSHLVTLLDVDTLTRAAHAVLAVRSERAALVSTRSASASTLALLDSLDVLLCEYVSDSERARIDAAVREHAA